jgi:hypothetical protein
MGPLPHVSAGGAAKLVDRRVGSLRLAEAR